MKKRTGYLFRRKAGGNYYVQITVKGNRFTKSTGTPNKRKAEKVRDEIMKPFAMGDEQEVLKSVSAKLEDTEKKAAKLEEELNPPPKIKHVFSRFLESPERTDAGDRTLKGYESSWNRFEEWLADTHPEIEHLHEVTPAMAKDYSKHLKDCKVSASTFNQHKNLLRMVWRVMADDCRLKSNPWEKIQSMKLTPLKTRKRALTRGQYENLLAAAENEPDMKDLFVVLAWTGLRLGDAVLLKWASVDFSQRVISVAPAKTARRQGKVVYIPIFPAAEAVFNKRQGGIVNPSGYVFPEYAEQYKRERSAISSAIKDIFERAGMPTSEKRQGRNRAVEVYGAHSFRHFFVTVASAAGMPAAMIKSITGHSTDGMLEHYQQMGHEIASEMAERIQGSNAPQLPETTAHTPADDRTARIKELAEQLDENNWREIKEKLAALAPPNKELDSGGSND